ncbi:MAG: putative Na+/H+ antiporter [Chlamydiota bacterium]
MFLSVSSVLKPAVLSQLEGLDVSLFHTATLLIFVLAIFHTFMAGKISKFAQLFEDKTVMKQETSADCTKVFSFWGEVLYFFGEVEIIFGLWVIPLFLCIVGFYSWDVAVEYINTRDYTEPLFVVVIMTLASTKPIVRLAESVMRKVAGLFGGTIEAWWCTILSLGPLTGSFITEAGAMTLCAMLLSRQFFSYAPSKMLSYATVGLLFVNVSVGGVLTNFAAPPVLIIARTWNWSSLFMFYHFGMKAILGVFSSTMIYWLFFRKEFQKMETLSGAYHHIEDEKSEQQTYVPVWITFVHVIFLVWTVLNSHYPVLFIGGLLFFLGFMRATKPYQYDTSIKAPILVGFFLAGLIIHGGVQAWWVIPLISGFTEKSVMLLGVFLTAFNDNAAVAYLTSLIPNATPLFRYSVISGVVTGGGLTVLANAPNPAGYVILQKYFKEGISPGPLFLAALFPTCVFFLLFFLRFLIYLPL